MDMLGIPYMGSKRKLSKRIIDFILKENPNTKYFYDLFGGGGAMSFEAQRRPQIKKVFYNDLNTGVVELLKDLQKNGVTDKYYQWVDKDTFNSNKNADTWLGGFCKVVWSFGNNQKDYLYGKSAAMEKKMIYEVLINRCEKSLKILNNIHQANTQMNAGLFEEDMESRRLRIERGLKVRLEHLTRINQLKRLKRYDKIEISNLSYSDVEIKTPPHETIVYFDPPYEKKRGYQEGINYEDLYEYIENSPYKIYMSGYESHLPCVLELNHTASINKTKTVKTTERLYSNE